MLAGDIDPFGAGLYLVDERAILLRGDDPAFADDILARCRSEAIDVVIPHPVYAKQAWASILNPGDVTGGQARTLLTEAHGRAATRHRPRP